MTLDHCYQGDCRDVMRSLIAEGVRVQCIESYQEHFDICKSMRARAVALGAVEIDRAGLAAVLKSRRSAGT